MIDDTIQTEALISTVSVDALLMARDHLVETLERAGRDIGQALTNFARFADYPPAVEVAYGSERVSLTRAEDAQRWKDEIDRAAWRHLFSLSGIGDVMSTERKQKLHGMLYDRAPRHGEERIPPLTRENIAATFEAVFSSVGEMFEESVEAVYRKLSWDYRTNVPCKFGQRMILEYGVDTVWSNSKTWRVPYDSRTVDLERVVCRLAKIPQPDHRSGLRGQEYPFGQWVEGKYEGPAPLRVKGYKKRTLHVEIADPAIVEAMNKIMAKRYPGQLAPERK